MEESPARWHRRALRLGIFTIVVLAVFLLSRWLGVDGLNRQALTEFGARLREWQAGWGPLGPVVVVLIATLSVVANVPTILTILAVAALYPAATTVGISLAFWALGCSCVYLLGHVIFRDAVRGWTARFLPRLSDHVDNNGLRTVLFTRLLMFAAPPSNWALAALNISYRDYLAGSLLGGLPHILLWCLLGPRAVEQFLTREPGWWHTPEVLMILIFGVALSGILRLLLGKPNTVA